MYNIYFRDTKNNNVDGNLIECKGGEIKQSRCTWISGNYCFVITSSNHTLFKVIKSRLDICNEKN